MDINQKLGRYLLGVLILAILGACKDPVELPKDGGGNGEPEAIFKVDFDANQDHKKIEAKGEYILSPRYDSLGNQAILVFESRIGNKRCVQEPKCPGTFSVLIRDDEIRNDRVDLDTAWTKGERMYTNLNPPQSTIVIAQPSLTAASIKRTWSLNGRTISDREMIRKYFDNTGSAGFNLCLKYHLGERVSSEFCRVYKDHVLLDEKLGVEMQFMYDPKKEFKVTTKAVDLERTANSFHWSSGGIGKTKVITTGGDYYLDEKLTAKTNRGLECSIRNQVFINKDLSRFQEHQAYYTLAKRVVRDPQRGSIEIRWMDDDGNLYSSIRKEQPNASFFKISDIQRYKDGPNGDPTVKLVFEFACILYPLNNSLQPIVVENGKGVMAFQYPE